MPIVATMSRVRRRFCVLGSRHAVRTRFELERPCATSTESMSADPSHRRELSASRRPSPKAVEQTAPDGSLGRQAAPFVRAMCEARRSVVPSVAIDHDSVAGAGQLVKDPVSEDRGRAHTYCASVGRFAVITNLIWR